MTVDTENTTESLRAFTEDWARLSIAGNRDGILSMLTDDVVFLPPGQPIVEGKKAVEAWLSAFPSIRSFNPRVVKAESSADFAWARIAFEMTVESSPGKLTSLIGKGTCTYRKQADGKWLIFSDVWNFDN